MKILIDMNLAPSWVSALEIKGIEAIHCYIEKGALITIDDTKARIRLLPI